MLDKLFRLLNQTLKRVVDSQAAQLPSAHRRSDEGGETGVNIRSWWWSRFTDSEFGCVGDVFVRWWWW